jgi:hypothetical protein
MVPDVPAVVLPGQRGEPSGAVDRTGEGLGRDAACGAYSGIGEAVMKPLIHLPLIQLGTWTALILDALRPSTALILIRETGVARAGDIRTGSRYNTGDRDDRDAQTCFRSH